MFDEIKNHAMPKITKRWQFGYQENNLEGMIPIGVVYRPARYVGQYGKVRSDDESRAYLHIRVSIDLFPHLEAETSRPKRYPATGDRGAGLAIQTSLQETPRAVESPALCL